MQDEHAKEHCLLRIRVYYRPRRCFRYCASTPAPPIARKSCRLGRESSRIVLSSCSFRHSITTYISTPVPNALLSPASPNATSSPALIISNQASMFLDDQRIAPVRDPQTKYFSIIHFEIPYIQPSSAKSLKPVCLEALGWSRKRQRRSILHPSLIPISSLQTSKFGTSHAKETN